MILSKLAQSLQRTLPRRCVVCRTSARRSNICTTCLAALPELSGACTLCAMPFQSDYSSICGPCLIKPPPWQHIVSAFHYAAPVNALIPALKYHADFAIAAPLAAALATRLAANRRHWPDAMVPLPLHWRRQWRRGFNQAHEIARHLQRDLAVPVRTDLCARIKNTPAQTDLDHRRRQANVKNAFMSKRACDGLHLAIVDDVLTTGATMAALCSELRRAGAATLEVWTCARVVPTDSPTGIR